MPKEWADDCEAIERFTQRMSRIQNRSLPIPEPKMGRNPTLKFLSKQFPESSKNIDFTTPDQPKNSNEIEACETFTHISEFTREL